MTPVLVLLVLIGAAGFLWWRGLYRVPDGMVGVVFRRYGQHPEDRYRVRIHGSAGPQATVLVENRRYWLPPLLTWVELRPKTRVPDGTLGVVEATAGAVRPLERRLCRYVECDYFQDAAEFLRAGGEQGRQPGVLPGGASYSINTELFRVTTVETLGSRPQEHDPLTAERLREVEVPVGNVGVVIVLDGLPPREEADAVGPVVHGHDSFRRPWVFLAGGGHRGVQGETLSGGSRYAINPWFAHVVLIPTRDLHLEWTKKSEKAVGNFDSALEQITVDLEGHRISLEMSQILRIPPEVAPVLVRRFGEQENGSGHDHEVKPAPVQRFVERVLGAAVAGYFTALIGKYTILQFIEEYDTVRLELQRAVTDKLDEWGVKASETVLGEFDSEDRELYEFRRTIARARDEKIIAGHRYDSSAIEARTEALRIRLDAEREVAVVRELVNLLGPRQVAVERIAPHLAAAGVPQVISGGGGDLTDQLVRLLPVTQIQELLRMALTDNDTPPLPTQSLQAGGAQ